ncbi:DUF2889 domain-containing protein [Desulfosarcina sp.]|uniref:DUF2889 domain-containing protein n=1 Tax=Desulfosarcina sp. TaxID=2027861 RepID=UPI00356993E7
MGSLKDLVNGTPFHSRSIEMKTYALDDDTILVEGWLREDRFEPVFSLTGEKIEPGPVHHMAIRLKLGGTPPTILDAEAEMVHVPLEFCRSTLETIQHVIGLEISAGFKKKAHAMMGGEQGCVHLTHLLTVMSQAAFQGHVAHKRKSPQPLPASLGAVEGLDALLGSCRAWRRGGPKVTHLQSVLEGKGSMTE